MQTFDVLIAPGPSSNSVSCFFSSSSSSSSFLFSSPVGRDHSGKQGRRFQPHPPACPPCHPTSWCCLPEGSPPGGRGPCRLSCPSPAPGLLPPPSQGAVVTQEVCVPTSSGLCAGVVSREVCVPCLVGSCALGSSPGRCVSPLHGGLCVGVVSREVCVPPSWGAVCWGHLPGGMCPPRVGGCALGSSPWWRVSPLRGGLCAGVVSPVAREEQR